MDACNCWKVFIYSSLNNSLIGIGEIALLPLDALKIKMQTNAAQYEKQSFLQVVRSEGWGLYRGASWTAARVF